MIAESIELIQQNEKRKALRFYVAKHSFMNLRFQLITIKQEVREFEGGDKYA